MFPTSYFDARVGFLQAASACNAVLFSHDVDSAEELTVDVAVVGQADCKKALIVTSGLHGVEGYFGSAVQTVLLDKLKREGLERHIKVVLVHALNPFGFKHVRRFDQDNVDLNRNFLASNSQYSGAPDGYAGLSHFLNPESPPTRFEPYTAKAFWTIWRYGLPALKASIVSGQYEHPKGIFFGGSGASKIADIVRDNCDTWLGDTEVVAHIDLHSGLGAYANYKLLLNEDTSSAQYRWYADTFGTQNIEPSVAEAGTAYDVTGSMGGWLQQYYSDRQYYFANAEFGTYSPIRVLGAIRAENRAHHFSDPSHPAYVAAKAELLECFCPRSEEWRKKVLGSSLEIITAALEGLRKHD